MLPLALEVIDPESSATTIVDVERSFAFTKSGKLFHIASSAVSLKRFVLSAMEVAIPGTSEHHTGLAVDIVDASYNHLNHEQAKRPTQKWLMEHCHEYGFILRYPKGKTDSTGIIYEPWHYRYVGTELAQELHDAGLTLEEYLQNLTQ